MSSEAQLAANRANAQLSSGPQTESGLAAIAHNNFRHGLASTFVVLPSEDSTAYDDLLLSLNLEFSPSTETEEMLVTAMGQHHWLTQRALRLQQPLFEAAIETGAAPDGKQLGLYLRYQSTNDRAYHKALSQLLRLRSDRSRSEIGWSRGGARCQVTEIQDDDPFLLPAHQTGRADFQHPASRRTSRSAHAESFSLFAAAGRLAFH